MNISRARLAALLLAAFLLGSGAFAYVKYRNFSGYLITRINRLGDKELGRRIKFKKVAFSPFKGVVIEGPCVSRAPDFSKGTFFCADRAVIRPDLAQLLKNRLYFSSVRLEKPVIRVRKTGDAWDFSDLLARLPKTSKGLHLTWNARKFYLTDARVEADMVSADGTTRSISLENADAALLHFSALAGNFALELDGVLKTVLNGELFGAKVSFRTDLNFEYAGLTSAFGRAEFSDAVLGAATLQKAALDWKLFNVNEPAPEKNYGAVLSAEGLFIPAQSGGATRAVNDAMKLLSSIRGKAAPKVEDILLENLELDLQLHDSVLRVRRLDLRANFLELHDEYELNGPARTVNGRFTARFGENDLGLSFKGPMDRPEFSPALSVTLNRKLLEAVRAINTALLKVFPVTTGEIPHA